MIKKAPNQNSYINDQNFNINIEQVYNDFIKEIDAIRSYTNTTLVSDTNLQQVTTALEKGDRSALFSTIKTEQSPQESRCHAFYRIIGFPVVSKDKAIYNPGFDKIKSKDKVVPKNEKYIIANSPLEDFRKISNLREDYVNNILHMFSTNDSIDASVLSLSSKQVREFNTPFNKSQDAFNMTPNDQSYTINLTARVGEDSNISLLEFQDQNGNQPTEKFKLYNSIKYHIISPFMTDPIIDFLVNDSTKLVAVPFVPDKSFLFIKTGDNGYIKRPILEKVLTDRFSVKNQSSTLGTADATLLDKIVNNDLIKDENIIQRIGKNDIYSTSEQLQFLKFYNIIDAMLTKLVSASLSIDKAQSNFYWLPIPSKTGPENGCTVRGAFLFPDKKLVTKKDSELNTAWAKFILNNLTADLGNISGKVDKGNFAFENFKTTFGPDTTKSLGDSSKKTYETLSSFRSKQLIEASSALRTVEIIMGEFSGLGLCDIIAVMAALYVMPKENLIGFLDGDALKRFNSSISNTNTPATYTSPGIEVALNSFVSTIRDFYMLMDKLYKDKAYRNGL